MKRVWRSRRGNALPLAIGTMLVVFALCGLLLSLALYANRLSLVNKQYFDQRLELDSIAQEFRVLLKQVAEFDETQFPGYLVRLEGDDGSSASVTYDGNGRRVYSGEYRLTVQNQAGTKTLMTVLFTVNVAGDNSETETVTVNRWVYGGLSGE